MGLRDFIQNMRYGGFRNMVEDFADLGKEAKEFVVESKQEFSELMTDGFTEMVIKGNSDYKTSFEKCEEAEEIISASKSKLEKKAKGVERRRVALVRKLEDHTQLRGIIFKDFITDFKEKINESKEMMHLASENNLKFNMANLNNDFSSISMVGAGSITYLTSVSSQIQKRQRVKAATQFLEDAKEYREQVNVNIEKLEALKIKFEYIEKVIDDESRVLRTITENIETIKGKINYYNNKISLNEKERGELFNLLQIAEFFHGSADKNFITQEGNVSKRYIKYVENVKSAITKLNL